MKKYVIICIIAFASCKNEKQPETVTPKECTGSLMVIDKSRFASVEDYQVWASNNPYICHEDENSNLVYISMDDISPNDPHATEEQIALCRAEWLANNRLRIHYYESYRYIEDSHRIKDAAEINDINDRAVFKKTSLGVIKSIIKDNNGNFDDDNYNKYVAFNIQNPDLRATLSTAFQFAENNFSMPMLQSVAAINNIQSKDDFYIGRYAPETGDAKMVLRYKQNIYNFSDEPKKKKKAGSSKTAQACRPITEYINGATSQAEKVEWLRTKGKDLCPNELETYLEQTHNIPGSITITRSGKPLQLSYTEVKKILATTVYDRYFELKINASGDVTSLTPISAFNPSPSVVCYSAPLLNHIMRQHSSGNTLVFTSAVVNSRQTAIIEVKGIPYSNYDFSDEPSFTNPM
jgi:hypothetical protein